MCFHFKVFKYQQDKKEICRGILYNHLKRRMTHEQLQRACEIAMEHKDVHWAVTLRCVSNYIVKTVMLAKLTASI